MSNSVVMTWLKVASAIVIGFGFIVALAAYPPTAGVANFLLDLIFWPIDGVQSIASPEMRLLCAIAGGIMVGWGVLLWLVATRLYPRAPELARALILSSIGAWFVVDSAGSIVAGAWLNAIFNIGFLALFYFAFGMGASSRNEQ